MKLLKIIIPVGFGVLAVIAVLIFSFGSQGGDRNQSGATLVMWGTLSENGINPLLELLKDTEEIDINYRAIDRRIFEQTFIEGLADGIGPDLIILPHDLFISQKNKLFAVDYEFYSQEQFINTFARAGEIFLTSEGIYAFPFAIDPMVMYWNKDLFSNESIALPPKFWREFFSLATKLTKLDVNQNITQSFVAMGESGNITHGKELLSAMMMQTGERFTRFSTFEDGELEVVFGNEGGSDSVLGFYTEFSDPRKSTYSWNTAIQNSLDAFAAGNLALFFGFSSDYPRIVARNPHIDIGVAEFPQIETGTIRSTYGDLYSIALLVNSPNLNQAFSAAISLTHGVYPASISLTEGLVPARLDLLSNKPVDERFPIYFDSAIKTKVWLDPDPDSTRAIMRRAVAEVTIGRLDPAAAIQEAKSQLEELIRRSR